MARKHFSTEQIIGMLREAEVRQLQGRLGVPIHLQDERLSTVAAHAVRSGDGGGGGSSSPSLRDDSNS